MTRPKAEKKRTRRIALIVIACILVGAPLIWFAMYYFAEESLVDYKTVLINGDTLSVILTEKTSEPNRSVPTAEQHSEREIETTHFGYFLELYDSNAQRSLDKIKFSSPVWEIQGRPELRVFPDGTVWVISTSNDVLNGKNGFILKFEIRNQNIVEVEFTLDPKYRICNLEDNKVILTEGNSLGNSYYNTIFGCTYFDLETGEIVVVPPYDSSSEKPVNTEDYLP